ncbi:GGDEF domain-containing protein [Candidatus Reidiella endopervernicosa]|uniref:GGDEF domain-containing protein n=1 Tax=Candidatus Reidiella endopervernicosa TaxID=2738883 RepID=A0A6N0I0W5_9GAMM|nr:GGDEF domain-containing protein [Candidatus Reidiella endopervernicosa]
MNDSLGHPVGDEVLKQVASRLKQQVREDDTIARLGGDEFTLLVEEIANPTDAAPLAKKNWNNLMNHLLWKATSCI